MTPSERRLYRAIGGTLAKLRGKQKKPEWHAPKKSSDYSDEQLNKIAERDRKEKKKLAALTPRKPVMRRMRKAKRAKAA